MQVNPSQEKCFVYFMGHTHNRSWLDLVPWWRHQMETFSTPLLALCEGNPPMTGRFPPSKASNAELWWFLWSAPEKNGWANNRNGSNFRRQHAPYDITVMVRNVTLKWSRSTNKTNQVMTEWGYNVRVISVRKRDSVFSCIRTIQFCFRYSYQRSRFFISARVALW